MLCPVCRPEQNNAGTLHEERAQIAIATFSDAAKDGTITRGHMLRYYADPRHIGAPLVIGRAVADSIHHGYCNHCSESPDSYQLPTAHILPRQSLDFISYAF